nr:VOC family protein [Pseudomaricurvus alkylphenolicus]
MSAKPASGFQIDSIDRLAWGFILQELIVSSTDPIQYISFVALMVSDIDISRRFYIEALGFEPISHLVVTGRSPTAVELGLDELRTEGLFLQRDGMRIQLQQQDRPPHCRLPEIRKQLGLSHFGIRVENLDAALDRVRAFGGNVPEGHRHKNEQYQSQVARIEDPDGVRMELLQMPGDPTNMPGNPIHS